MLLYIHHSIIYNSQEMKTTQVSLTDQWLYIYIRRCRFNPWVGKIPEEGNGNPLQYSCLGNPKDRGAWQTTVHGVPKELDRT